MLEEGEMAGVVDIVSCLPYEVIYGKKLLADYYLTEEFIQTQMHRKFTLKCIEDSKFITLSYESLLEVRHNFPCFFEDIFRDSIQNLYAMLRLKLRAIQMLEGSLVE
jgi:hypothetical protein